MKMKLFLYAAGFATVVSVAHTAYGEVPRILAISEIENSAREYSPRLKSLISEQKAARERAAAQKTQFYPKLFLDGSYKYNSNVPQIELPLAGFKPIQFGDNANYSIGPAASWTLWDAGVMGNAYRSAYTAAEAKNDEVETVRRKVILEARESYFQATLAGEQVKLYTDALKLAQAQYDDIKINVQAGTKNLVDELQSHQEVLTRMRQLRQSKADTVSALVDLSAVTGKDYHEAEFESMDNMLLRFEPFITLKLNKNHPSLAAYTKIAESTEYLRRASEAARWPKLMLSAKSSLDYPNGMKLESCNQNAVGATVNWTLFESGASRNRIKENEDIKAARLNSGEQALADISRQWDKNMEQVRSLEDQRQLNEISVAETDRLAQIIYKTYKTGSISFLEVENANFKALEAKIQSARTKVQILMSLAILADMAE